MFAKLKHRIRQWWAAFLISVLGIGGVYAQVVTDTVSWTAPTLRVDGSALPASEINGYNVYSSTSLTGPETLQPLVTGLTVTLSRGTTATGTRCYSVATVDTGNAESDHTARVCKTVKALPSAVTGLAVN